MKSKGLQKSRRLKPEPQWSSGLHDMWWRFAAALAYVAAGCALASVTPESGA